MLIGNDILRVVNNSFTHIHIGHVAGGREAVEEGYCRHLPPLPRCRGAAAIIFLPSAYTQYTATILPHYIHAVAPLARQVTEHQKSNTEAVEYR